MTLADSSVSSIIRPKVSVVIPAYNAMHYLPETLNSVFKQTYQDFEVLVVDDGSTDSIQDWFDRNVTDVRVKLIAQRNQGLSAARNTGIGRAQGEYIAFLDADDLWHPLKLAKQVDYLDHYAEVGLIYNWVAIIDADSKPTGRIMGGTIAGNVFAEILQRNIIDCPSVLVRRQCFDRVGLFDVTLRSVEDWDMWIRIAAHYAFAVTQEPLVYYRQHSGNMSKNWKVMEQAFLQAIDKSFESVPSELQYLKKNSLGYANLCVAWKVLQNQDADSQLASKFQQKAISNYPKLRYSSNNLRLTLAIAAMQLLGVGAYNKLLAFVFAMRRRISGIRS
jgi:glycosyltransferase involved in cell wall biosynthesis